MSLDELSPPTPSTDAPEPRRSPAAAVPAVLIGLILCGIAALCLRELLVYHQLVDEPPWLANASVWIAQLQWQDWMMGAAPAMLVVGLLLAVTALKPRARTHLRLKSDVGIWLRPTDLARMCSAIALEEPGVLTAITTVTATRVEVEVTAARHGEIPSDKDLRPDPEQVAKEKAALSQAFEELSAVLRRRIQEHVSELVDELEKPLEIRVRIQPGLPHAPDHRRRVI